MKNIKKIGLGLSLALFLLTSVAFLTPHKARAASIFDDTKYTRVSDESIQATLSDGTVVPFVDNSPTDKTYNYLPIGNDVLPFKPAGIIFCNSSTTDKTQYGITLASANAAAGKINVIYSTSSGCISGKNQTYGNASIPIAAASPVADASNDGSDTSGCVANSHTSLEWIFCPLITAVSKGADQITNLVESQLNFDINGLLTPEVHKAWTIFKDLVSVIVVIVLLVMVISQAIGEGPFDAYTIKKLLPKLVIAVVAMQLSWEMCIFFIGLANDLGTGIGQIIAAPFGGAGNLDLGSLLNHFNAIWAFGTSASLVVLLVAAPTLGILFLPGVALAAFGVFMSALIGLATLLFRNALIIVLVMFSPVALLLWALPGQFFQRYWKMWNDNFAKLLVLFPIMMAIIYGGRAFAYIAGGLGASGPLDFIMVLVGFFVPYAILPKAFKWGGNLLSAANRAVGDSGPIKKLRDSGNKLVGENFNNYWKGRMARDMYDPYDKTLRRGSFKLGKSGKYSIPMYQGKLAGRLGSQHWMPTAHGRAQTLREGATWAEERTADANAFNTRRGQLAQEHGYATDEEGSFLLDGEEAKQLGKNGKTRLENAQNRGTVWAPGQGAQKQAYVDMTSVENSGDLRISKNAIDLLIKTSSNPEIAKSTVSYGSEAGKYVYDTRRKPGDKDSNRVWNEQVGGSSENYGATAQNNYDIIPHVTQYTYPKRVTKESTPLERYLHEEGVRKFGKDRIEQGVQYADEDRTLYALGKDATFADLIPQSLGFWQRQNRHTKEAGDAGELVAQQSIGDSLVKLMGDTVAEGQAGAQKFSAVRGEKEEEINAMLANSAYKITAPDGSLQNLTVAAMVDMASHGNTTMQGVVVAPQLGAGNSMPLVAPKAIDPNQRLSDAGRVPAVDYRPGREDSTSRAPDDLGHRKASGHPDADEGKTLIVHERASEPDVIHKISDTSIQADKVEVTRADATGSAESGTVDNKTISTPQIQQSPATQTSASTPAVISTGGGREDSGAFTIGSPGSVVRLHDETINKLGNKIGQSIGSNLEDINASLREVGQNGPRQSGTPPSNAGQTTGNSSQGQGSAENGPRPSDDNKDNPEDRT